MVLTFIDSHFIRTIFLFHTGSARCVGDGCLQRCGAFPPPPATPHARREFPHRPPPDPYGLASAPARADHNRWTPYLAATHLHICPGQPSNLPYIEDHISARALGRVVKPHRQPCRSWLVVLWSYWIRRLPSPPPTHTHRLVGYRDANRRGLRVAAGTILRVRGELCSVLLTPVLVRTAEMNVKTARGNMFLGPDRRLCSSSTRTLGQRVSIIWRHGLRG